MSAPQPDLAAIWQAPRVRREPDQLDVPPALFPDHWADLERSGIPSETAQAAGLYSFNAMVLFHANVGGANRITPE